MRQYISLIEDAQRPITGWGALHSPEFTKSVHDYIAKHLGDWLHDFHEDKFHELVLDMLKLIWRASSAGGGRLTVYRSELRPASEIEDHSYGSVGQFWSWSENGAGVCHHDNGYEEHGTEELEDITFHGTVSAQDVNWTATVAKNLILKNEREITIKDDAAVLVDHVFTEDDMFEINTTFHVRSNGHEDDF